MTAPYPDSNDALELFFFGSNTCGECLEIKEALLRPLERRFGDKLKIYYHDTDIDSSHKLMLRFEAQFDVKNPSPQELFFPDTVLLGYSAIMANTHSVLEEYMNDPQRRRSATVGESEEEYSESLRKRFSSFAFGAIIVAAFADSINPCAIATMIFLVSFMATQKRKRSEILIIGLSYTAAVFVTYLLLGVGIFKIITGLSYYRGASLAIKWLAVSFAGIVGIISFVDALRYKKSKNAKNITLQLPKSVKMRIHKIISTKMTGSRLVAGAIITGFLVTLLEAVCTGQVYLPTIAAMAKQSQDGSLQLIGWLYLLMYNFIFVTPLLLVMVAAYHGVKWNKLSKMMQDNLTMMKILLGTAMIGIALYLAFA
jgi:hypothetical protein